MGIQRWLTDRIAAFLEAPVAAYELRSHNDFELLRRHIRKGDVLLVEGDQRVSAVVKYLTQSSWSHAALYVGDELRGSRDESLGRHVAGFGDDSRHALVEALVDGVVVSPLGKYEKFNIRLCRPHRLAADDLRQILDDAVEAIGWHYDLRNIVDLAVYLLRVSLMPRRRQREALALGSGSAARVICTSLLGQLFHAVKYPVLPSLTFPDAEPEPPRRRWPRLRRRESAQHRALFHRRHPTLLTPRDFDLSPYFDIVKFNVIEDANFDYQRISWAGELSGGD